MLPQHLFLISALLLGAYGKPGDVKKEAGYGSSAAGEVKDSSTATKTSPDPAADGMVYTTETIKHDDGSEEYIITGKQADSYETVRKFNF
ncbi:hypothetical protein K7432_001133 [Basidiobolus ranarum]|uniref:Uncharacterized protein n=1 Tax=Basidiobolus ranarum TaxID=34480 RepID=A0ABR2X3W1_9FUNG